MRVVLLALLSNLIVTGVWSPGAVYRLPHDSAAVITTLHTSHGNSVLFVRTDTGAVRFMQPVRSDLWNIGPALVPSGPVAGTVLLDKTGITIETDGDKVHGTEILLNQRRVQFHNGGLTLHGTVLRPAAAGTYPGIVLMHGSDDGDRYDNGFIPYFFASRGFAVLEYDKRGSGESVPSSAFATASLLARDGIAAAHELAGEPGVDTARIGVWGASQGGMLSIVMAGEDPLINFAIDQSGYFTPTWEADLFEVQSALRDAQATETTISAATAFENQKYEVARTRSGWQILATAASRAQNEPWFANLYMPKTESALYAYWERHASFDPTRGSTVNARVLGLYGSLDNSSPLPQSANNLISFLARSRNVGSIVVTFPNVNHLMLDARTGSTNEVPSLANYDQAYLQTLSNFLDSI